MMHGVAGAPATANAKLAGLLRLSGAIVYQPRTSWSRSRIYDTTWDQDVLQIDQAIAQVRAAGARIVVLAGHSMGGGATLVYAARRQGPDALMPMAPAPAGPLGATPEYEADIQDIRQEIQRAKQLIAAGYGDVWGSFLQADVSRLRITTRAYYFTTARNYLSHNPVTGFSDQAAAPRIPVLWVNGDLDLFLPQQRIAYSMMPKHPKTRYIELPDTFHEDVPDRTQPYAVQWLQSLKR